MRASSFIPRAFCAQNGVTACYTKVQRLCCGPGRQPVCPWCPGVSTTEEAGMKSSREERAERGCGEKQNLFGQGWLCLMFMCPDHLIASWLPCLNPTAHCPASAKGCLPPCVAPLCPLTDSTSDPETWPVQSVDLGVWNSVITASDMHKCSAAVILSKSGEFKTN